MKDIHPLKEWMLEEGITQAQLRKMLAKHGLDKVTQPQISRWCNRQTTPSVKACVILSHLANDRFTAAQLCGVELRK